MGAMRRITAVAVLALGLVAVGVGGPAGAVPPSTFTDVPADHPFYDEIEWMAAEGISTGYPDGSFQPAAPVSRQAMASFLWSYEGKPAAGLPQPYFADVAADHPFYAAIQWMAASGLSTGSPNPQGGKPLYKPTDPVSRQAMASFLWRSADERAATLTAAFFSDVAAAHTFYGAIQWMAQTGLSTGTPNPPDKPLYKPGDAVSRQAMSAFLFRFDELERTERVSVSTRLNQATAAAEAPSMSADGRYVAFHSPSTGFAFADSNGTNDVFVRDRLTDVTTIVSVSSDEVIGNGASTFASISDDGRYVAFQSLATNLVAGDTNGATDVFVRDLQDGTTIRVSLTDADAQAPGGGTDPSISGDGKVIAFQTSSSLVPADIDSTVDVYVRDRVANTSTRVSVPVGDTQSDGWSFRASASSTGRYVAFQSEATNLLASMTAPDDYDSVYVRDVAEGTTTLISVDMTGGFGSYESFSPSISGSGRYVAFESGASDLVPGDDIGFDVFVRDRQAGTTKRISQTPTGATAKGGSTQPDMSPDGRWVAFGSAAPDLVPGDTNSAGDMFVANRATGAIERVSVSGTGAQGTGAFGVMYAPSVSSDGRFVAYGSAFTNLVPGDTNNVADTFVWDRLAP